MNKQRSKKLSWISAASLGVIGCILISMIFLLIATALIKNESILQSSGYSIIVIGQVISVFASCLTASKLTEEKKTLACITTGGIYYLMLLAIAILFYDGMGSQFLWGTIATTVGIIGSIFIANKVKTPQRRKRRIRRFR